MSKNGIFWKIQRGELPVPQAAVTLGMEIREVDETSGTICVTFDGKADFLNPAGQIQGGFLMAMLDDTLGPALTATLEEGEFAPTLEMKVQFLAPALTGQLTGRGRVISRGGTIAFLEGELYQAERLIAKATATAVVRRLHRQHVS
ncbi:PaaI family thioesterase [Cupriavidus basilensis]|uniref:PaaI family thioesterase n=1 Tax=Cupriavidus basilensis TaxID=68895 RepID=A0ABT6AYG9_9BURK|nr:PaaI family thioesterase [Cupriavidus basilensis]MDF3837664.1 PaaI family thioesterase [Cupriavidus basilensis]